jgi:Spy/CpxP family protein refolding chaperone
MTKPISSSIVLLAMIAGMSVPVFAETDPPGVITVVAARYPEALERRVDDALAGTDATLDQKIEIVGILEPVRRPDRGTDTALREAMSAETVDPIRIEQLRRLQIEAIDTQSKRLIQAMKEISKTLDPAQRQAFYRNWSERPFSRRAEVAHARANPS